ncbi:ankyrin repeat domain-containing protein [Dactylosporangium sp. NPDC051541]|uniref:ankyrin repeat domain-containing protein n=1 Tax=Dactylosporangium sp. NPDC051541 TaxID=3363977 RepID=UPI0037A5AC0A
MIGDADRRRLLVSLAGDHSLSALKVLAALGRRTPHPDTVRAEVLAGWPAEGPVLALAGALLRLKAIDDRESLAGRLGPGLADLAARAANREEHFMTIAVADECGTPDRAVLDGSIRFFRAMERDDGTFGPDPLDNAIAASALLRIGQPLRDPSTVGKLLVECLAQADLWLSYCAMRALALLGLTPAPYPLDLPLLATADETYQRISIREWLLAPIFAAARAGDLDTLARHLHSGGDPDLTDLTGWTLLSAAAVRGQAAAVRMLLDAGADPDRRVTDADALPVFWAAQHGDVDTVKALLERRPEHVTAISRVNGHTVLLQAVFFGTARHRDLIAWLLSTYDPAPQLAACNVRGYTARAMAELWHNEPILAVLPATSDPGREADYRCRLLAAIAGEPDPPVDTLVAALADPRDQERITAAMNVPGLDLNRQGGPLGQTPIIAAVTGTDPDAATAEARRRVVTELLGRGADPDLPERHPMAVDAVIRAAVLNHFECLREFAVHMPPLAFAAALNERPAINGQTALDDTVHRALTADESTLDSHLEQIRWAVAHGARPDIPDHTGVTPLGRATAARADPILRPHAAAVLAALGTAGPSPGG